MIFTNENTKEREVKVVDRLNKQQKDFNGKDEGKIRSEYGIQS